MDNLECSLADGAVRDFESESAVDPGFAADVRSGLSGVQKTLPSKYFYDSEGSALFEAICETPEYYPTRTELALLGRIAPELAKAIAPGAVLIEYGSGASLKTRTLLDAAPHLGAYMPVDISPAALLEAVASIRKAYPQLAVRPVVGDFTQPVALPEDLTAGPRVGFFPGSTIGNFTPPQATAFLAQARRLLGSQGAFILGADLVKSEDVLVAAYDDRAGVTAQFNLNLLARINRELGGDFDLDAFEHSARWNAEDSRMEMHLVSRKAQSVRAAGLTFRFEAGETIHTENSHKFTAERLDAIAHDAGWRTRRCWVSPAPQFAVTLLEAA